MGTMRRIVVGIDHSDRALVALDLASQEATRRGAQLEVVWAWGPADVPPPAWETRIDPLRAQRWAQAELEDVTSELVPPGLPVVPRAVNDDPASALVEVADGADLLVVGARGAGGFLGLRLGSVSTRVLTRAPCPVAVVRDGVVPVRSRCVRPIVVGADGSDHARLALRWALDEARLRGAPVRIVHGWSPPLLLTGTYPAVYPPTEVFEKAAQLLVDDEVRRARDLAPDVATKGRAICASAAMAVVESSGDAAMAVVGSRGLGRAGRLLGSVSLQVAHHSTCPVVVVPDGPTG